MRIPIVLLSMCAALSAACGAPPAPSHPHRDLGHVVPAAHERALGTGERVELPASGKVTVVDFWAIDCKPCKQLMPRLGALAAELRESGVVTIGVAHEANPVATIDVAKERGATYPQVLDPDGRLDRIWQVGGHVPTTFVVDRKGRIHHVRRGADDASVDVEIASIRAAVRRALEASE